MKLPANRPRVIVALDFADPAQAMALADRLDPRQCAVKVGKELFVVAGPEPVRRLVERGFNVFLDLKFHDIPNTVAQACAVAARMGVWMIDVHAAGGRAMLTAARDAVATATVAAGQGAARPLLVAVTVLTSLDGAALAETGVAADPGAQALRLAILARHCGLDGVVCSAIEAPVLRAALGPDFALVTPGIRPAGSAKDDQARIVTPEQALARGASFLVIGRPITAAADPVAALAGINRSLGIPA
ncbi:MAG TPA: orotidine-5'-phosphate decarboxylase [Casimicrobiaceae bacterium]|nr:orotidine-5'-phosphate decarboxylase [Casimicrobiaceae bacterium]